MKNTANRGKLSVTQKINYILKKKNKKNSEGLK